MVAHPGDPGHSRSARRLNEPRPALVACEDGRAGGGRPVRVAELREEWRVDDRWWTEEPVERRYFEALLETGRNVVVFRDEASGGGFGRAPRLDGNHVVPGEDLAHEPRVGRAVRGRRGGQVADVVLPAARRVEVEEAHGSALRLANVCTMPGGTQAYVPGGRIDLVVADLTASVPSRT